MAVEAYEPPPDPDFAQLASTAWRQWEMDQPKVIAFDTETTGLTYYDRAFGASVAWVSDDVIQGRKVYGAWFDFDHLPNAQEAVRRILSHADVIVGHNLKFDAHKADRAGIAPDWTAKELHDTEAMAHLLDEHRRKGLKDLMVSVLGWHDVVQVTKRRKNPDYVKELHKVMPSTGHAKGCPRDGTCACESWPPSMLEYTVDVPREKFDLDRAKEWAKKRYDLASIDDVSYDLLPRGTLVPYAIMDAVGTYHLGAALHPQVLAFPDLTELYEREMQLTRVIYDMERRGMATDGAYVQQQVSEYRTKVLQHEATIQSIVGKPVRTGKMTARERPQFFNPDSSDEVGDFFARAEGFRRDSYNADALKEIQHPLAGTLLAYRADAKILRTYLEALRKEVGPDGIYHMSMRQHGTVSGRTSNGAERGDM